MPGGRARVSLSVKGGAVVRRVLLFVSVVAVVAAGVLGVPGATVGVAAGAGGAQTAGGRLDPSFGRGGIVLTPLGFAGAAARAVAIQTDGRVVAAGSTLPAPREPDDFALVRYTLAGKLDPSFGTGGKVLKDLGGDDEVFAVAVQKDGKIVAVGDSADAAALVRFTTGGRLDSSFGTGGKVIDRSAATFLRQAVAIQKDGKIVVVGWSAMPGLRACPLHDQREAGR